MKVFTLEQSMNLAGQCCLAWLNPERDFMPTGGYEVAHDTGRWWDAMLRLEDTTGFEIPEHLEEAMLQNRKRPDTLCLNLFYVQ